MATGPKSTKKPPAAPKGTASKPKAKPKAKVGANTKPRGGGGLPLNPEDAGVRARIALGLPIESKPEQKMGRPRTKIEDLPEGWADIMREAAQEGCGPTSFMVKLGILPRPFATLLETSEDFRGVYEECRLLCAEWWEGQGRRMSNGGAGSAAVWAMNMTNRFNWRSQRNELVGDPTAPVQTNVKTGPSLDHLSATDLESIRKKLYGA